MLDLHAESLAERVDRALEARIVEGDEPAALLAHEVVVMVGAVRMDRLEPGLSIADRDPLDPSVLHPQPEHAVDARPSGRAARDLQLLLDLDGGQRALLRCEQLDHALAGAAALEPGHG